MLDTNKDLLKDKIDDWQLLCNVFIETKNDEFSELDWLHAQAFMRLKPLLNSNVFNEFALESFILSTGLLF